jgi:hypothetical protein
MSEETMTKEKIIEDALRPLQAIEEHPDRMDGVLSQSDRDALIAALQDQVKQAKAAGDSVTEVLTAAKEIRRLLVEYGVMQALQRKAVVDEVKKKDGTLAAINKAREKNEQSEWVQRKAVEIENTIVDVKKVLLGAMSKQETDGSEA